VACVASYRERYAVSSLTETEVFMGIPEAVEALSREHRLAVATSKAQHLAEPLLAALGLRERLDFVAGPGIDVHVEDKATTIRAALDALDAEPAVMVGDRSFDVVGAHANGLPAIGVTWGIGTAEELADADALVDEPAQLPAMVANMLTRA
jgi:phosphoglycolate phosphatase